VSRNVSLRPSNAVALSVRLLTLGAAVLASCTTFPAGGPRMLPVDSGETRTPSKCVRIGSLQGPPGIDPAPREQAEERATSGLQTAAASIGANYVRLERFVWSRTGGGYRGSARGTGFWCTVDAPPVSTLACVREAGLTTCSVLGAKER
jgi:hypothetical protein